MSAPLIDVQGLTKAYRQGLFAAKKTVLHGITLQVGHGEAWALLGPNGAGKSTLIQCLVGLLRPDGGSVHVLGQAPHACRARERLGYLPDLFVPIPHLTVRECLAYYGALSHVAPALLAQSVEKTLHRVGLQHAAHQRVEHISKGTNQRLGIASTLVHDPDVFIWDEPTSGLDPEGRRLVVDLTAELKAAGKTILLVTHILSGLETLCDHVALLQRGRLPLCAAMAELQQAPGFAGMEELYLSITRGATDER